MAEIHRYQRTILKNKSNFGISVHGWLFHSDIQVNEKKLFVFMFVFSLQVLYTCLGIIPFLKKNLNGRLVDLISV